jgi:PAS domain S-box-containing protein
MWNWLKRLVGGGSTPAERLLSEPDARRLLQAEADRQAAVTKARAERRRREQFQVTLSSIGDAVIITDVNGKVTFLNPVAQALTGWEPQAAAGQPLEQIFRIINEETRQPVEDPVRKIQREGVTVGLADHTLLIARDGRETPIDDSGAPIRGEGGAIAGVVFVFRDVAEARRATAARLYLAAVVESSDDAIIGNSLDGTITSWNRGAERLYGYRADEAVGRPLTLLVPPDHPDEVPTLLQRIKQGEHIEHFETVRLSKDGSRVNVSLTISPVRNATGKIIGVSKIARDISERLRLERELRQRMEQLAAADRRKDEFLAMLAHELRNPLAPIRNSLHIMKMQGATADMVERARQMTERQVRLLVRLVDDLLDVSRIMRGRIELRHEPVELAEVLARAAETAHPTLDAQGQELLVSPPAEPLRVRADPARLAQVVGNLLGNAAKFSSRAGRVWLSVERQGEQAVLRVRDEGTGISADLLPHVFDLFVQADTTLERSRGGLGIGLTLVRRLVELHGGTVTAASEGPGKGSEFVVRLPLLPSVPQPDQPSATGRPPPNAARRVLVVDDNVDAAESTAALVRLWGHHVRVAHTGPEALRAAEEYQPEVVLLDIGLPGMSGYEVARRLREQPHFQKVVLAALTGYGQGEDCLRAKEARFDVRLTKPVDPDALRGLLDQATSPAAC